MPAPVTPSSFFFSRSATVLRYPSLQAGAPGLFATDGAAGRAEKPVPVPELSGLACSVQPSGGNPTQLYGQRALDVDTELYFALALDVRADDVVEDDDTKVRYVVKAAGDEAEQGRVSWVLAKRYR